MKRLGLLVFLLMAFLSSISLFCYDEVELNCPTNPCVAGQSWQYIVKRFYLDSVPPGRVQSPGCWVEIYYRKKGPVSGCNECDVEIIWVHAAGMCFYSWVDPSFTPPKVHPPYFNFNTVSSSWAISVHAFLKMDIEPCFKPSNQFPPLLPGDCKDFFSFKSATCKKEVNHGDYVSWQSCLQNSCCKQKLKICVGMNGAINPTWDVLQVPQVDCDANDPDCVFHCNSYPDVFPPLLDPGKEQENSGISVSLHDNIAEFVVERKECQYQIFDHAGSMIGSGDVLSNVFTVDLNNFPQGSRIFFINFIKNGTVIHSQSLIKQ